MKRPRPQILAGLIAATLLITIKPAFAQFSPGGATISTSVGAQTLSSGTGTVTSSGTISVSGSTVGVTVSGTSTLNNDGTIQNTSSGRAINNSANNSNLTINNTGLISSGSSDAIRIDTANSAISLTNSGTIRVINGGQAIDWAAITTASNTLNNLAGGQITAVGEDAVRPGQNGIIINAGTISATVAPAADPAGADGIDLRIGKTVTVTNTGTISGRHGIATDGANTGPSSLTVHNDAGTIFAINGSGLNVDGVATNVVANVTNAFGATIKGGVMAAADEADGDGIDVDGVLTLTNSGDVLGLGAKGAGNNAEGIAAGGGTIINTATGRIIGSTLAADAPNSDTSKAGNGILIDNSDGGNAVAATTITNSGLIEGKSGFGVRIIGNFDDSITNNAGGTIRGAGATTAVQTGSGNDTVTNRGSIIGLGGSAVDLEGGDDTLKIEGNLANIQGSISGGSGTNTLELDLGAGNNFAYAGSISNFSTVHAKSGTTTLSGVNTYTGKTRVTGNLVLLGSNRVSSSSALELSGGHLKITSAGANGQTFASLTLEDSSFIDLDGSSSLTFLSLGTYALGETLSIVNYSEGASPDYAIRFLGNLTADSGFLSLIGATNINGGAADYLFDGTYTNVGLAAIPEPSTIGFGLVLLGLAGIRQRRLKTAV